MENREPDVVETDFEEVTTPVPEEKANAQEPKLFLTKEAILGAEDLHHEDVFVKEWNGWVQVWALSGQERDRYESSLFKEVKKGMKPDLRNLRAKLVVMCVRDQNGKRLFSNNDVEALGRKSSAALDMLYGKAQELSGLRPKDVEELQKNLESVQKEDSNSD